MTKETKEIKRNKDSKTYTIEMETKQIIANNRTAKGLSSDSASLERIVLEWNILTSSSITGFTMDKIVDQVSNKMDIEKIVIDTMQKEIKKIGTIVSNDVKSDEKEITISSIAIDNIMDDMPD